MFLRIHLQGQCDGCLSMPAPYTAEDASFPLLYRVSGRLVHACFAKDLWNIHAMYALFSADELVILPETVVPYGDTEMLFLYGGRDPYLVAEESVAYIKDMLAAPHIQAVILPGAG